MLGYEKRMKTLKILGSLFIFACLLFGIPSPVLAQESNSLSSNYSLTRILEAQSTELPSTGQEPTNQKLYTQTLSFQPTGSD